MGAAAYNRGSRRISAEIQAEIDVSRATNDARALLWRDLLDRGLILSFRVAGGAIVTAGPHHEATGRIRWSMYREEGDPKWRGSWIGSSWSIALLIVEHAGRKRPYKVA
jgi:hypothetical protein